jgi:hypothetical protein
MAVLTAANCTLVYSAGAADKVALFALSKVSAGDTVDVAPLSNLLLVQRGVVLGISDFVEIAATFTGTVVTMPSGLSSDSAYLLVWGC